jgi:hypothetical protein
MLKAILLLALSTSAIAGDRIVQQDERGNNLYHKQQYIATQGKMCPINAAGYREYNKPCLVVSKEIFDKLTKDSK